MFFMNVNRGASSPAKASALCVIALLLAFAGSAFAQVSPQGPSPQVLYVNTMPMFNAFEAGADNNILAPEHTRIFNGRLAVGPAAGNMLGFANPVSPPFITEEFTLTVKLDGETATTEDHVWTPIAFEMKALERPEFALMSRITTVHNEAAFLFDVQIKNQRFEPREVEMAVEMKGFIGKPGAAEWGMERPAAAYPAMAVWDEGLSMLAAVSADGGVFCRSTMPGASFQDGRLVAKTHFESREMKSFGFLCAVGEIKDAVETLNRHKDKLPTDIFDESRNALDLEMYETFRKWPWLRTMNMDLLKFYNRSVMGYFMSRWRIPEAMGMEPFWSSGGSDGRGAASGLRDFARVSRMLILADPAAARNHIRFYFNVGADAAAGFSPIGLAGVGAPHPYNDYSAVKAVYDYVAITGDARFLIFGTRGGRIIDVLKTIADRGAVEGEPPTLIDYGPNETFLNLKKPGYEHFAPTPNARRVWIYRAVADLIEMVGDDNGTAQAFRAKADALSALINEKLWDTVASWHESIDTEGKRRHVWARDALDVLQTGVPSPEQTELLIGHINQYDFLAPRGVYSMALREAGGENPGPDWEGNLAGIADAPDLVETLYRLGKPEKAEELLDRILWIGGAMPYYPETVRVDEPGYDRQGRSNSIASLAGAQAVIFGVFGVEFGLDGSVTALPRALASDFRTEIKNLRVRGVDITMKMLDGKFYHRLNDYPEISSPLGERATIIPGAPIVPLSVIDEGGGCGQIR